MSVSLTEQAVVDRRKTVTRRLGWAFLRPGDRLTLCRKVMGRRPGEPLVRLAEVEVVDARREPLLAVTLREIDLEAVAPSVYLAVTSDTHLRNASVCRDCRVLAWVEWFARTMGVPMDSEVTRIEWRYLS